MFERYFERVLLKSPVKLAWWALWQNLLVAGLAFTLCEAIFPSEHEIAPDLEGLTPMEFLAYFLVWGVAIQPFVETLLQTLPIALSRRINSPFWVQVVLATGMFTAAHGLLGVSGSWLYAGVIGGFYSSFLYVALLDRFHSSSHRYLRYHIPAYLVTSAIHSMFNLVLWALAFAGLVSEFGWTNLGRVPG